MHFCMDEAMVILASFGIVGRAFWWVRIKLKIKLDKNHHHA
jgi:hypothetical protein